MIYIINMKYGCQWEAQADIVKSKNATLPCRILPMRSVFPLPPCHILLTLGQTLGGIDHAA